jgi:hypothetical protein
MQIQRTEREGCNERLIGLFQTLSVRWSSIHFAPRISVVLAHEVGNRASGDEHQDDEQRRKPGLAIRYPVVPPRRELVLDAGQIPRSDAPRPNIERLGTFIGADLLVEEPVVFLTDPGSLVIVQERQERIAAATGHLRDGMQE